MQDFTTKQNALFACLDDASKELKGTALDQSGKKKVTINALERSSSGNVEMMYRSGGNRTISSTPDNSLSCMRGKESIFKKPELPITRCLKPRRTPDYEMNPHKWKKYSLSDVDISDHTNTYAAFAFLKQIDEQQDQQNDEDNGEMQMETKIEFKKLSKIRRNMNGIERGEVPDVEIDKPKLKGSKLIMPEYVIGQKKESRKRQGVRFEDTEKSSRSRNLKLAHLQEDEDE